MLSGDLTRRGGRSTFQRTSPYYSLFGIPEGQVDEADFNELNTQSAGQAQPGRVAFGAFASSDAAIGLIVGTLLMLYLGSRVIVEVKKK